MVGFRYLPWLARSFEILHDGLDAGGPMVKGVDHLPLVQWQIPLLAPLEDVAPQAPAIPLQLLACAKEVRVIGHIEHPLERDTPRVPIRVAFADEDRHPSIDRLGQLGVAAGAEDRTG